MQDLHDRYCELMGKLEEIKVTSRRFSDQKHACLRSSVDETGRSIFDVQFLERCQECLTKQVTSSSRRSTDQSRINELSEIIQLLRSCLREYILKTKLFVETCEKDSKETNEATSSMLRRLERLQEKLRIAKADLYSSKEDKLRLENSHKKETSVLKAEIETVRKENHIACQKVSELLTERKKWNKEKTKTHEKIEEIESTYHDLQEQQTKKFQQLEKRHCKLQASSGALQQQKEELQNQVESLVKSERKTCIQLQKKEHDFKKLQNMYGGQSDRLESAHREIKDLRNQVAEAAAKEVSSVLVEKVSLLQRAYQASEEMRRKLLKDSLNMISKLRILFRVLPTKGKKAVTVHTKEKAISLHLRDKSKTFSFDRVYEESSTQVDVYRDVEGLVQGAFCGEQICVLSFGQKHSGKSYTMIGGNSPTSQGIIPRALIQIMETVASLQLIDYECTVESTVVQIHNKEIRDSLKRDLESNEAQIIRDYSTLKGKTIRGATKFTLSTMEHIHWLLNEVIQIKKTKPTSRHHLILTLYIKSLDKKTGKEIQSTVSFVDLAGTERLYYNPGAKMESYKEICGVNGSVSCLMEVLSALASNQRHIPYRNSKLTYWLQPYLQTGKILLLAHLSPSIDCLKDSIQTIKFALRLRGDQSKPYRKDSKKKPNENPEDSVSERYPEGRFAQRKKEKLKREPMSPERIARKRKSSHSPSCIHQSKQRNLHSPNTS